MIATILPALVKDLSGVQLVGWSFAIYELGSISRARRRAAWSSYISLRTNIWPAPPLYGLGALLCALSPPMPFFLLGRLIEGFGGGALDRLAYVSVERLFPRSIWPQLFAMMSAVWGVAAFGGPLLGRWRPKLCRGAGHSAYSRLRLRHGGRLSDRADRPGRQIAPRPGELPPPHFLSCRWLAWRRPWC